MKERAFFVTEEEFLVKQNKFGNTVLHEATIYGNYEAVRLLAERCADLLSIKNNYGETPLFTAAEFGEAEIVEFLIRSKPKQCVVYKNRLLSIHSKRSEDGLSILSAAIIGQHFGKDIEERSTAKNSLTKSSLSRKEEIPLLIATRYGIEEIVGEII